MEILNVVTFIGLLFLLMLKISEWRMSSMQFTELRKDIKKLLQAHADYVVATRVSSPNEDSSGR